MPTINMPEGTIFNSTFFFPENGLGRVPFTRFPVFILSDKKPTKKDLGNNEDKGEDEGKGSTKGIARKGKKTPASHLPKEHKDLKSGSKNKT